MTKKKVVLLRQWSCRVRPSLETMNKGGTNEEPLSLKKMQTKSGLAVVPHHHVAPNLFKLYMEAAA